MTIPSAFSANRKQRSGRSFRCRGSLGDSESVQAMREVAPPFSFEHYQRFGMGEENTPMYLCRGVTFDIQKIWWHSHHWN
jgi:hypothetical protein